MKKLTLRGRILLGGALVTVAVLGSVAWSEVQIHRATEARVTSMLASSAVGLASNAIETALREEDEAVLRFMVGRATGAPSLAVARDAVDHQLAELSATLSPLGQEALMTPLRADVGRFREAADRAVPGGGGADAWSRHLSDVKPLYYTAVGTAEKLRDAQFQASEDGAARAEAEFTRGAWVLFAFDAAVAVVATLLWWSVKRRVDEAAPRLKARMLAIGRTGFEDRSDVEPGDELGDLAAAIDGLGARVAARRRATDDYVFKTRLVISTVLDTLPAPGMLVDGGEIVAINQLARELFGREGPPPATLEALLRIAVPFSGDVAEEEKDPAKRPPIDMARTHEVLDVRGTRRRLRARTLQLRTPPSDPRPTMLVLYEVDDRSPRPARGKGLN